VSVPDVASYLSGVLRRALRAGCALLVASLALADGRASAQIGMTEQRCSGNVYPTCLSAATTAFAYGADSAALRSVLLESDNTPLNGRMPVLFIHGFANSGLPADPDWAAFDNMLVYLKEHGGFQRFKPYRITWYSNRPGVPVSQIAAELAEAISQYSVLDPQFGAQQIAVVAHSTGGLIARELLVQHLTEGSATFKNKLAYYKVARIITLATPHHGSPAANGDALDVAAGNYVGVLLTKPARVFVERIWGLVRFDAQTRLDLHWDNFSATSPDGDWYSGLPYFLFQGERNGWLEGLNTSTLADAKLVTWAGYISPCIISDLEYCVADKLIRWSRATSGSSDGVVPLESALFETPSGTYRGATVHVLAGYDHSDMHEGKVQPDLSRQDPWLFGGVLGDLNAIPAINGAAPPSVVSISPSTVVGSNSLQTFTVTGNDFSSSASVTLQWSSGQSQNPSGGVTVDSATQLHFSVVTGTTADTWSVRVENQDGQVSPNAVSFAVTPPTQPSGYTLSTSALYGSITRAPSASAYASGTSVTLSASPVPGYTFAGWIGDASGSTSPTTITMNGDKAVTGVFIPVGSTGPSIVGVSVDSTPGCLGIATAQWVTLSGSGFASGSSVLLSTGGWTGALSAGRTDLSGVPSSMRVCAVLTQSTQWSAQVVNPGAVYSNTMPFSTAGLSQFTVTTASANASAGEVSAGGTWFDNTSVVVVAYPYTGYKFVNWTENGAFVSANASYSFVVRNSRTLVATFAAVVTAPISGSLTVNLGPAGARGSGAGWRLPGETLWRTSGSRVLGLPFGSYTVEYKQLPTWNPPPSQLVSISSGGPDVTIAAPDYVQPTINAPSNLSATVAPDGSVQLAWQDNASNEGYFFVERQAQGETTFRHNRSEAANSLSAVDGPYASFYGTLCYRVRASDPSITIYSTYSNEACATPEPLPIDAACYAPPASSSVLTQAAGRVAAGYDGMLAVRGDGSVWRWGLAPAPVESSVAIPVAGLSDVTRVAMTSNFAVALKRDGTVWAWGMNDAGQLGNGTTVSSQTPTRVSGLSGIVEISAGASHGLALGADGRVWAWGYNGNGQLGDGTQTTRTLAAPVSGVGSVKHISAGSYTSFAVLNDASVVAWGANPGGLLGVGVNVSPYQLVPAAVPGLSEVTSLSAGPGYAMAVRLDGTVWAWGQNSSGRIGDGVPTSTHTTPFQIAGLTGITSVATGQNISFAVRSDGIVYGWGSNTSGIGDGSVNSVRYSPVQVVYMADAVAVAATTFYHSALALRIDGTLCTWGENSSYMLGNGGPRLSRPVAGRVRVDTVAPEAFVLADSTPDAVVFGNRTVTTPGGIVTSNTVTVAGMDSAAAVHADHADYSINGGPFVGAEIDSVVRSGDTLALRVVAPASPGQTTGRAYVGGVSADFVVTLSPAAPPTITTHPQSQAIAPGATAAFSVVANGTPPFTYQWHKGISGDESTPVGSNSSSYTTPALISTARYWVRVSSSGGSSADSNTATVSVAFTDPVLTSGGTLIKAVHFTELRARINALRQAHSVVPASYPYTHTITATTGPIYAVDLTEMRTALAQVYAVVGGSPSYSTNPTVGATIRAADIADLRTAVTNIE